VGGKPRLDQRSAIARSGAYQRPRKAKCERAAGILRDSAKTIFISSQSVSFVMKEGFFCMGEFRGFMKLNYIVDFFKKHDKNILPE